MNGRVLTAATAINRSWVTSTARQRLIDHHNTRAALPPRSLPHSVLAGCWPYGSEGRSGVLGWRAVRWPWSSLRSLAAVLWPSKWTGHRHPWLSRAGRLLWTITGLGLLVTAAGVVVSCTAVAIVVSFAANVVAFVAVASGWSPPMAFETIPAADLDTDRALFSEDDEHDRSSASNLWGPDDGNDPNLTAQRHATRELARHNDLLEQQQPPGPPLATHGAPQGGRGSLPAVYYGTPGAGRPWGVRVAIWLFVASTIVGCVFFLTAVVFALWSANGGTQPPTNDELITSIHDQTEARIQQRANDFAEAVNIEGEATP